MRRYLSDASFGAIGGYCPELKIFWRYTLDARLTAELKRKAETKETSAIRVNLLELAGMFMTAWVVHMIVGDRPQTAGDAVLLRGDNVSAVSWVNKCGGAKDRRAGLLMRLLGRMEITSGWCHFAKHIPGLENTLADGISRWPENKVHEHVARLTNDDGWKEQNVQAHGKKIFSLLLQNKLPAERLDEQMWLLMNRAKDATSIRR